MDSTNSERRRHTRVKTRLPLEYRNLRGDAKAQKSVLINDISEGGVKFVSSEFLSLANRLIVTINIPTTARQIKAISKIAWIKKISSGDKYEIGNQFLEISREDKVEVARYIKTVIDLNITL